MKNDKLYYYWQSLPVGKENKINYTQLAAMWNMTERACRKTLQMLSTYDSGDNYILIRSSKARGFYKTNDEEEILKYKKECMNKGKSIIAAVTKINKVLNKNDMQFSFVNNSKAARIEAGLKQQDVILKLQNDYGIKIDPPLFSKIENNMCLPPDNLRVALCQIYGCRAFEIVLNDNTLTEQNKAI